MNSPEQNNYIQYITRNGLIKTKSVLFNNNGFNTTFVVKGIIEEFFILAVFQNNLRVFGVGFDDIENNDMLGFLNSDLSDVSLIPPNAFMPSENVVTMSYNNQYIAEQKGGSTASPFVDIQKVDIVSSLPLQVEVINQSEGQSVYVANFPNLQYVQLYNESGVQSVEVSNFPIVQDVNIVNLPPIQEVSISSVLQVEVIGGSLGGGDPSPQLFKYNFPHIAHLPINNYSFVVGEQNFELPGYESIYIDLSTADKLLVNYMFVEPYVHPFFTAMSLTYDITQIIRVKNFYVSILPLVGQNLLGYAIKFYFNNSTNEVGILVQYENNDSTQFYSFKVLPIANGFKANYSDVFEILVTDKM